MSIQEVFAIHIYHGYIGQLFLAEMLFLPVLKHRKYFWVRLIGSALVYALLSIVTTNLLYQIIIGLSSITIFFFSLGMCAFSFQSKFKDVLYCCIGAQLIQNLSHNLENLIYLPLRNYFNNVGWFFLSMGMLIVVYSLSYVFIIRRQIRKKGFPLKSWSVLAIATASALFCYLMQFLLQYYKLDTYWITTLPLILCDILALIIIFGLVGYKQKIDENLYLEHFIAQSDRYYKSVRENIDLLNLKAHDLKHFLSNAEGKASLDEESLKDLKKTVDSYETMVNTGNKGLDYVLADVSHTCQKKHITFSINAEGVILSFLTLGDLTSLFSNLLSNAVEYEEKVEEEGKRYILLKVISYGKMVSIHVENYCPTPVQFQNGYPVTTKADSRLHGFGTKSIVYIAKKYHGTVTMSQNGDIFQTDILFPEQGKRENVSD